MNARETAHKLRGMDTETLRELSAIVSQAERSRVALDRVLKKIGKVFQEDEDKMAPAIDDLKAAVEALRTSDNNLGTKITDLQTRLQNNPSEADVAAVAADLGGLAADVQARADSLDTIDPDVPGGVQADNVQG